MLSLEALLQPLLFLLPLDASLCSVRIGQDCFLSGSVKQHLGNLYDKFGVSASESSRRVRLANDALRRFSQTYGGPCPFLPKLLVTSQSPVVGVDAVHDNRFVFARIIGDGRRQMRRQAPEWHEREACRSGRCCGSSTNIQRQSLSARVETVSLKERGRQAELLGKARALLADLGVKVQVIAGAGDPLTEILAAASELDTETIVVGRRAGTAPHLVHGSLSSKLVRRFERDVLVVH